MVSQNSTTFTNVATIVKINRLSMQNLFRSNHWRSSVKKKMFFKILQNLQENTCARVSLLTKLQTSA